MAAWGVGDKAKSKRLNVVPALGRCVISDALSYRRLPNLRKIF